MPNNEYRVQTGDTLSAIARRHNVALDVLARANGISDVNRIYVGQVLKIPEPVTPTTPSASPQPQPHRVTAGETLATISQRYQIPEKELLQLNGLQSSDRIVLGQVLLIPTGASPKSGASETQTPGPKTPGATQKPTPTSPQTQSSQQKPTAVKSTIKDEDNLELGVNELYREALLAASRRTGLPPQTLAAMIHAEAAKDKMKRWKADSKATTSTAAGLAQFLAGTWLGEACREGTALHEYARGHDLLAEILDKKGRRIGWKVEDPKAKTTLLELRLKPEMSIMAAAELAVAGLETVRKAFKVADSVTRSDLARIAYLFHHEGATGADRILRQTDTHTKADLTRQVGSSKANDYLSKHEDDATRAYRDWLGDYIDDKIDPLQFARDKSQFPAPRPLQDIVADLSPVAGTGDSYTPAPTMADVTTGKAVLRPGMKGPAVEQLQKELLRTGYLKQAQVKSGSGIYGPATKGAVESFQRSAKLPVAAGALGLADKATWDALRKAPSLKVSPSTPSTPPPPAQKPPAQTPAGGGSSNTRPAVDLQEIARNVRAALGEGFFFGLGTNEQKVYSNLARLNHDATLITQFKQVYQRLHGVDVVADIRSEFSNNQWYGPELNRALSYLEPRGRQQPKKDAPKGTTPSLKATPDLQALLQYLHVSIEEFVGHENAYFSRLTMLLARHGTIKAAPLLTRDTFREAVRRFQQGKRLESTTGLLDETTVWELQVDWAKSRKLQLVRVSADELKAVGGYNNFTLREDAVAAYNAFRNEVVAAGGIVTSAGSLRELEAEVTAGRSSTSMHYSGLALDLATYSGMRDPQKDRYVITQDGSKWRVWCKSDSAPERTLDAIVHSKQTTRTERITTKAFDFTAVAEKHGFARIGPRSSFPKKYESAEWWHFQYEPAMTRYLSQFGAELLSLARYDEAKLKARQGIWDNRMRIFKRGTSGWH